MKTECEKGVEMLACTCMYYLSKKNCPTLCKSPFIDQDNTIWLLRWWLVFCMASPRGYRCRHAPRHDFVEIFEVLWSDGPPYLLWFPPWTSLEGDRKHRKPRREWTSKRIEADARCDAREALPSRSEGFNCRAYKWRKEGLESHHSRVPQKSLRKHAEAHGGSDSLGGTPYKILVIIWAIQLYYLDQ